MYSTSCGWPGPVVSCRITNPDVQINMIWSCRQNEWTKIAIPVVVLQKQKPAIWLSSRQPQRKLGPRKLKKTWGVRESAWLWTVRSGKISYKMSNNHQHRQQCTGSGTCPVHVTSKITSRRRSCFSGWQTIECSSLIFVTAQLHWLIGTQRTNASTEMKNFPIRICKLFYAIYLFWGFLTLVNLSWFRPTHPLLYYLLQTDSSRTKILYCCKGSKVKWQVIPVNTQASLPRCWRRKF